MQLLLCQGVRYTGTRPLRLQRLGLPPEIRSPPARFELVALSLNFQRWQLCSCSLLMPGIMCELQAPLDGIEIRARTVLQLYPAVHPYIPQNPSTLYPLNPQPEQTLQPTGTFRRALHRRSPCTGCLEVWFRIALAHILGHGTKYRFLGLYWVP